MRLGILGGSFDPIHVGHLIAAEGACGQLDLARVVFVPASSPPHKRGAALAPAAHRLRMVELAIRGNDHFEVDDCEVRRQGTSYTIDTILDMRQRRGEASELVFVMGSDTIRELPTWHEIGRLSRLCGFAAIARPGQALDVTPDLVRSLGEEGARRLVSQVIHVPVMQVSSTEVRQRLRQGRSVRYLVPDAVIEYIRQQHLYRD